MKILPIVFAILPFATIFIGAIIWKIVKTGQRNAQPDRWIKKQTINN